MSSPQPSIEVGVLLTEQAVFLRASLEGSGGEAVIKLNPFGARQLAHMLTMAAASAEPPESPALKALDTYVKVFGGIHEKGCPEDDTCTCTFVRETNEILAAGNMKRNGS